MTVNLSFLVSLIFSKKRYTPRVWWYFETGSLSVRFFWKEIKNQECVFKFFFNFILFQQSEKFQVLLKEILTWSYRSLISGVSIGIGLFYLGLLEVYDLTLLKMCLKYLKLKIIKNFPVFAVNRSFF